MTLILLLLCVILACALLAVLAVIDLRVRLLPNIYVFPLAVLGLIFHALSGFQITAPSDVIFGSICGGGFLYVIRMIANRHYKADTLGLGDVKLMAAAGIWLGLEYIFLAISLGALAGIFHGLIYILHRKIRHHERVNLATLSIPAGPGFIIGVLIAALIKVQSMLHLLPVLP